MVKPEGVGQAYKKPVITVIVAVFNGVKTLQRCIDSVASQSYQEKELIIMDGGSTDGTVEILKDNSEKISYWKSEPDHGIYHAWNKALRHSRGEWICFLGCDDYLWDSRVLELIEPHLRLAMEDGIRVVYGKVAFIDAIGNIIRVVGVPWSQARKKFSVEMSIPHPGTFHHKSIFLEHGNFNERFRFIGDYELLMRELKDRQARFVRGTITTGFQDGGLTNRFSSLGEALKELSDLRRNYNLSSGWLTNPSKVRIKMILAFYLYRLLGERRVNRLMRRYRSIKRN